VFIDYDLCVDFTQAFATTLRALRHERKLSQESLAELSGVHLNSVGLLERGEREPSLYMVFQLAQGLNMSPSEIVKAVSARKPKIESRSGPY
jgi:transcriptional regulator with XRE-family HTH domain